MPLVVMTGIIPHVTSARNESIHKVRTNSVLALPKRRGEEKRVGRTRGKLLCHLVAEILLLANRGHSCVPAGAHRLK